jgi:hypothetical protein
VKLLKKLNSFEEPLNSALDNISWKQWEFCVHNPEKIQDEDFAIGNCKGKSHGQNYN